MNRMVSKAVLRRQINQIKSSGDLVAGVGGPLIMTEASWELQE